MNPQNLIIVLVLLVLLLPAIRISIQHMKGEGSCCGGPKERAVKKKIAGTKLRTVKISIEGMHCQNCKNRIEKHLNELDGVVAKVNLSKKLVVVSVYKEIDDASICTMIESLDFKVVGIE